MPSRFKIKVKKLELILVSVKVYFIILTANCRYLQKSIHKKKEKNLEIDPKRLLFACLN